MKMNSWSQNNRLKILHGADALIDTMHGTLQGKL